MKKNVIALAILSVALSGCWDTGDGERVGQVIKLNKQGTFCKTWEAEIIKGGMSAGSGAMGGAFYFTVPNNNQVLLKTLTDAMNSGQEVRVHYNMELVTFCRSDSDNHFVDKVEVISGAVNPERDVVQVAPAAPATAIRWSNRIWCCSRW